MRRKINRYERQKRFWGTIFILPWLAGFLIFFAYPFIKTIWYSFNKVKPAGAKLDIDFVNFDNYIYAFKELVIEQKTFSRVLLEAIWDLALNLPVILIFSLFIAVLLNTKFKGRGYVRAIFFIPVIFNAAAIDIALSGQFSGYMKEQSAGGAFFQGLYFQQFLLDMGIGRGFIEFLISSVDRIFRIVNLSGVQILIFLAAIQSIPRQLYEAAEIEGATKYETFWKITFPMVSPLFLTAIVFTIVDSFMNSPVVDFIDRVRDTLYYGRTSAVSVIYFIANIIVLVIFYLVVRKGVFYYDEN